MTELGYKKFIELEIIKNKSKNIKELSGIKCYDWSEENYHIAGKLGYVVANGLIKLHWIKRSSISRELEITEIGYKFISELKSEKKINLIAMKRKKTVNQFSKFLWSIYPIYKNLSFSTTN